MSNENKAAEYLSELLRTQGIATAEVKDGRLLLFTRKKMEEILNKHPDQSQFSILIQKPSFQN